MDLYEELGRILDALDEAGVEFALCGGVAVALHGHVRFTKDIDILILPEEERQAAEALHRIGYTVPGGRVPIASGELLRVSKAEGADLLPVDLLLAAGDLAEPWADREVFEWEGRRVPVVSRTGLADMKRRAGRPQDLADLHALESIDAEAHDDDEPTK